MGRFHILIYNKSNLSATWKSQIYKSWCSSFLCYLAFWGHFYNWRFLLPFAQRLHILSGQYPLRWLTGVCETCGETMMKKFGLNLWHDATDLPLHHTSRTIRWINSSDVCTCNVHCLCVHLVIQGMVLQKLAPVSQHLALSCILEEPRMGGESDRNSSALENKISKTLWSVN